MPSGAGAQNAIVLKKKKNFCTNKYIYIKKKQKKTITANYPVYTTLKTDLNKTVFS